MGTGRACRNVLRCTIASEKSAAHILIEFLPKIRTDGAMTDKRERKSLASAVTADKREQLKKQYSAQRVGERERRISTKLNLKVPLGKKWHGAPVGKLGNRMRVKGSAMDAECVIVVVREVHSSTFFSQIFIYFC